MRKLFWIIFSVVIFSSCEKQNELFFPPKVGDVKLYGETAKTVYAESYIEDSKNIEVTECGFCVYPNDDKTNVRLVKAVLSNEMFSVKIDSLNPGTYYCIKAYARNAAGVGYSDYEKKCRTLFSLAEISTNEVLEIRPTTAVCGGNVTSDGGLQVFERGVCWSISQNPTTSDAKTTDGTGIGNFTSNITGLTEETTYYVRAYATNEMGTAYGEEKSFLTTSKPTVTTYPVTEISDTSAVCGGNVTSTGSSAIVARGVCWATHINPTIEDDKTFDSVDTGSSFTSNITGLTEGTTYYVRAYATNADGTSYGGGRFFRTLSLPVVSTNAVTNISYGAATCGGNVSSDGGVSVTARGVCWSTSQNPTINDSKTIDGSGTGSFTSNITGLAGGTTYYVRAYATNVIGTAYGETKQFVAINLPTVQTNSATNVTTSGATISGNVISDGGANVTSRGFVYGTTINNMSQNIQNGSGLGTFTSIPTGLAPGTTYYYKAYATNSAGTSYGEVMQFTTVSAAVPTVSTVSATNVTTYRATLNGSVISDGGSTVTARGFIYGTNWNNLSQNVQSSSGTGNYSKDITGLSQGTTYYYMAYATNASGTAYGELMQFTTLTGIGSDLEVIFLDNFPNPTGSAPSNMTLGPTDNLSLCPVILNNGPEDASSGIITISATLGGYVLIEPESITLSSDNLLHSGRFSPILVNGCMQFTAYEMDQANIFGTFDLCFTISYSGTDPNTANNTKCVTITRYGN